MNLQTTSLAKDFDYASASSTLPKLKNDRIFVVVAGNIGSGKTTLTKKISERLNWQPYFESVDNNPYLKDFYENMTRWSFPLQVYFLTHRFNTHRQILASHSSSIQDRSIYEDANIFARALYEQGQMDKRDYENYLGLYTTMVSQLEYPHLMIFLKRSVPKLVERIKMRGRDYEQNFDINYLTKLNEYYDEWMFTCNDYSQGKSLIIDTDKLDFVNNNDQFEKLIQMILQSNEQSDFFYQLNESHF
ncbi:MAG: deoxynucleoside kinase [Bacteriovoracaceae bacterium]|nr:deoxynucleoside kinase [Bacteriovoracaceae bacterium]